jgi:hypothetical protein
MMTILRSEVDKEIVKAQGYAKCLQCTQVVTIVPGFGSLNTYRARHISNDPNVQYVAFVELTGEIEYPPSRDFAIVDDAELCAGAGI